MIDHSNYQIILASQSPRRKEILGWSGIPFVVQFSAMDEVSHQKKPESVGMDLARQKGQFILKSFETKKVGERKIPLVIAADTIVFHEGIFLGKPKNRDDARRMLNFLANKTHSVFTGVYLGRLLPDGEILEKTFFCQSFVTFTPINEQIMEFYLQSGDSMDKAGAYGVQGAAQAFIDRVEGSYTNVMGLPLSQLLEELHHFV